MDRIFREPRQEGSISQLKSGEKLTVKREADTTTYLLLSNDVYRKLQEQIPTYYDALKTYQDRVDTAKVAATVSPRDIETAYKKRQPVITTELEELRNQETNKVNRVMLESPEIPVLILQPDNPPKIIILPDLDGIGMEIILKDISKLKEEKGKMGVTVGMLPESSTLLFQEETMNPKIFESRSLGKNNQLNIGLDKGEKVQINGIGKDQISLSLS